MFTVRMTDDLGILDLMCCIPVDESFDGAERMEFAEPPACVFITAGRMREPARL